MTFFRLKSVFGGMLLNLIFVATSVGEITFSEIMFDPLGNENYEEFIEIYNAGPDSVDLTGWRISDQSATDLLLPVTDSGLILTPQSFAIILDPGYFENSTVYNNLIPESVLHLTIDNATFGSGGLSNSTAKTIQLLDSAGTEISAYLYSIGNAHGYSDEKINLTGPNSADNWADSRQLHGTPGFTNSVTPVYFDIGLFPDRIRVEPAVPEAGITLRIQVPVFNLGQVSSENFIVSLFWDENRNGVFETTELAGQQNNVAALASGDSATFTFIREGLPVGTHSLLAKVEATADKNSKNDQAEFQILIAGPPALLVINEIMFRPLAGEPEWFEIFNPGDAAVNLRNWKFSDSRVNSRIFISTSDCWLPSRGFLVVAASEAVLDRFPEIDSLLIVPGSFPALNNDGDAVVLWDDLGRRIDSVHYSSGWGGETAISLERKAVTIGSNAPENWGSAQNELGATPGARNSWLPPAYDLGIKSFRISPVRVLAPAEIALEIQVENTGENPLAFQLILFEDLNENQRADSDEIIGSPLPGTGLAPGASITLSSFLNIDHPGVHFWGALLEVALDSRPANNLIIQKYAAGFPKSCLVIHEFLHKPAKGFAEWIELFNPTDQVISLRDWTLTDAEFQHQVKLAETRLEIQPGQFLILANSAAFKQQFPEVTCPIIVLPDLPVLNNDADEIVVMDCAGWTIDSLAYTSAWVTETGVSLERVFWQRNSTDPPNWKPSQATAGATPGAPNSVEAPDCDLELVSDSFEILALPLQSRASIQVRLKIENPGKTTVSGFNLNFFNNPRGDSLLLQPVAQVAIVSILAFGDSLQIDAMLPPSAPGLRWLIAQIDLPGDSFAGNNLIFKNLAVGFPPGCLVINEIMFSPFPGQTEWIEVYNPGEETVDVAGWHLADGDGQSKVSLQNDCQIPAHGFAIIAGDSAFLADWPELAAPLLVTKTGFPSLNNEADHVWLFDLIGNPIDSVWYQSVWGGAEGISLERINPTVTANEKTNWNSCVFPKGGSPGLQNSIWIASFPTQARLAVSPDPFSPDNDGFDDFAAIGYDLPLATSRINLKIYDVRGRLIRSLLNSDPGSTHGTIFWDGKDDQNQFARMGIYVIYLEALNEQQGRLLTVTKTVVLAHRLD